MSLINFSLGDIGELFKDVREAITGKGIEDPNKKAEVELKLKQLEQALNQGQIEINKKEAEHGSIFVAGWRPFIGWVCGVGFAYHFVGHPLLEWVVAYKEIAVEVPKLHTDYLLELTLAMLGMGGLRTYEKLKGVSRTKLEK